MPCYFPYVLCVRVCFCLYGCMVLNKMKISIVLQSLVFPLKTIHITKQTWCIDQNCENVEKIAKISMCTQRNHENIIIKDGTRDVLSQFSDIYMLKVIAFTMIYTG